MSFLVFPVFQKKAFPSPLRSTGEHIGAALELLDSWAEEADVPTLGEFDGSHGEVPEDFDGDPDELELPRSKWKWFSPEKGIASIAVMIEKARESKSKARLKKVTDPKALLVELEDLKQALEQATKAKTKFLITCAY